MKKISIILLAAMVACESEKAEGPFDCSASSLSLDATTTEANCGVADGSVQLSVSGGEEPYTFSLDSETNETGTFEALESGSYTAKVTDTNGCETQLTVAVSNTGGVEVTELATGDSGCDGSEGSVSASAAGGVAPYSFSLSGQASETGSFTGLAAGSYTLTITDDNGCSTSQAVDVLTGTSLENDIMPIISNNCAISGCHADVQAPNLNTKSSVMSNAQNIKFQTGSGAMPQTGSLSDAQIAMIACWVDDGSLNN